MTSSRSRRPAARTGLALLAVLALVTGPGCGDDGAPPDSRRPGEDEPAARGSPGADRATAAAPAPHPRALDALAAATGDHLDASVPGGERHAKDEPPGDDAGPRGRWNKLRTRDPTAGLTPDQIAEIERLEAIGYVACSTRAGEVSGVVVHDAERAAPGLNLIVSGHAPEAVLMDMDGERRHRWARPFDEVWPDREVKDTPNYHSWRRAALLPDGSLLVIFEGLGLVELDRSSRVVWAWDGNAHHDLEVLDDGRILVLDRKARIVPRVNPDEPILEDFVTELDGDGRPVRSVSLLECLERSELAHLLETCRRKSGTIWGDIFHANTLEYVDGTRAAWSPLVDEGDVLVSLRNNHLIAVVDLDAAVVTWARAGSWRLQHQPTLLASGNILLFDNRGTPGRSAALELDPLTGEEVWAYRADEEGVFFSATCGSVQRLANGNTLITESNVGRAFEVTREGRIVWSFHSPYRAGERRELVATLFDVVRLPPASAARWLDDG